MIWLKLMELDDGTLVESSVPVSERATVSAGPWYRVQRTDGTKTEFTTMTSVLGYLQDNYDL